MNIADLLHRAALMRATRAVPGASECRTAAAEWTVVQDGRPQVLVVELGYLCKHGAWPPAGERLVPQCGTEGCVMHLGLGDWHAEHEALVASYMPRLTLAEMFRAGRAKGWFRGGGGYAQ